MPRDHSKPTQDPALTAAHRRLWPDGQLPFDRSGAPGRSRADRPAAARPARPASTGPLRGALRRDDRGRWAGIARRTAMIAGIGGLAAAAVGATGDMPPGDATPRAFFDTLDVGELTVHGQLRLVDDQGRPIAALGRAPDGNGGLEPLSLSLHSPTIGGTRETIRLSALETGGMLELQTPDRAASVSVLSGTSGPFVVLREADRSRLLSEEPERVGAAAPPRPLPAVSAPAGVAEIDLGSSAAQRINEDLFVVGLQLQDGALRGRIINAASLRHVDLVLDLEIGGSRAQIRVPMVSPGNSTGFEVPLRGVDVTGVERARIAYVRSTLRFHEHETWGASAEHGR